MKIKYIKKGEEYLKQDQNQLSSFHFEKSEESGFSIHFDTACKVAFVSVDVLRKALEGISPDESE